MSESYYPSKICRPILTDVLFRERLFLRLDTLRKQNVVWVSGPGGAGKTTLLNSYAEAKSLPCLWYQLDSCDQDPATFFHYLGRAGKKVTPLYKVFKDFLRDRCARMLNVEEMSELLSSAAQQLISNGKIIEAAQLLIEAKDWMRLGALINTEAQTLFQKGQFQTLAHWLKHIPEPLVKAEPWLLYWSGMCIMFKNPKEGRKHFEQSLNGFEKGKDVIGIYLAASGLGECLCYRFNSFVLYDQWIERLGTLHALYPEFPSKEIEAKVTISMLIGLSLRQPFHREFGSWRQRAHSLLEAENGVQTMLKIQLLVSLILDRLFTGNLIETNQLIRVYRSLTKAKGMPTLALLTLKNFEGHYHWKNGNPLECCRVVNEAMELANESGIHVLSFLLLLNGASGALSGDDHPQADAYLNRIERDLVQAGAYITTIFHHTKNWKYLLTNEPAKALFHAERAQDYAQKAGNPDSSAWGHLGLALALYGVARHEEAAMQLNLSKALSIKAAARQVTFACLLTQAEFASSRADKVAACSYLKEGFTLGRDNGYSNIPFWRPLADRRGIINAGITSVLMQQLSCRYFYQQHNVKWSIQKCLS